MTLNQLFLPIQKTLNICPASWPVVAPVARSRRTNQMPLAFPIHTANQFPTGQARAPHQFPACHGPAFPDCVSLFENLKNLQSNHLSIEQGSGITAATCENICLAALRTAYSSIKCRQARPRPMVLPASRFRVVTPEKRFFHA